MSGTNYEKQLEERNNKMAKDFEEFRRTNLPALLLEPTTDEKIWMQKEKLRYLHCEVMRPLFDAICQVFKTVRAGNEFKFAKRIDSKDKDTLVNRLNTYINKASSYDRKTNALIAIRSNIYRLGTSIFLDFHTYVQTDIIDPLWIFHFENFERAEYKTSKEMVNLPNDMWQKIAEMIDCQSLMKVFKTTQQCYTLFRPAMQQIREERIQNLLNSILYKEEGTISKLATKSPALFFEKINSSEYTPWQALLLGDRNTFNQVFSHFPELSPELKQTQMDQLDAISSHFKPDELQRVKRQLTALFPNLLAVPNCIIS